MQPLNRHPRIYPASKYRLGLRHGCKTGENRLFDSIADRDIGRVNLQDLPKTYWQVALLNSDRRYCDTITAHIAMNPIKFIIRLFGATV